MIRHEPMLFLELEFHGMFYIDKGHYDPKAIEESFEYGVARNHPAISDPRRGAVVSLDQWVSHRIPPPLPKDVVLQVLHIMPYKIEATAN